MTEGPILGHYISAIGIQVDLAKIQIILLIPTPTTQTEVSSFLGFSGYYKRFIEYFSQIDAPIYALTGNVVFIWTDKCDHFRGSEKSCIDSSSAKGANLGFAIPNFI